MTRTLIVSHSHPLLTSGGGEVAAYRQFRQMQAEGDDVIFMGAAFDPARFATLFPGRRRLAMVGPDDYCFRAVPMDIYGLEQASVEAEEALLDILLGFEADIYHFHHFWNIGAGVIRRLRKARPEARMICTLHEFIAICVNDGQFVKRGGNQLCLESGPVACALCFPEHRPVDFVIRRQRMLEMLDQFDLLLSPSRFLADRFAAWGVPPARLHVIENGLPEAEFPAAEPPPDRSRRFAYFGQATATKGLDGLIRAARWLAAGEGGDFRLDIFGVTEARFREFWPEEDLPEAGLSFRGRYKSEEATRLLRRYGWIVVPSVWWENSPVVIQEARQAGTPVIASDIGGMREKVEGWGRLFPVGDAEALGRLMGRLSGDDTALAAACASITPPVSVSDFLTEWRHLIDAPPRR